MNHRNLQRNDGLREHLAGGYVLGTLKNGARRRFERWLAQDPVLAQTVGEWQDRLGPMAEFVQASPPPARVWHRIEQRLGVDATPALAPWWSRLRASLSFWRGLALISSALAAVLLVLFMLQPPGSETMPTTMALLTADNGQPTVAISSNAKRMTVRIVGPTRVAADRSLELWAVPAQGAPLSLGLLDANSVVTISLPPNVTPQVTPVLAVSLEPKGGSPNPRAPSGPVIYKGAWTQL
jgi:anti-sigma-K factor RskA